MKAGRELDTLVATEVMKWRKQQDSFGSQRLDTWHWRDGHGKRRREVAAYSTDIAAAWEVREVVRDMLFSRRLRFREALRDLISDRCGVEIHASEVILYVTPADICLAALKAVGVELPEDES